jgi:hypothetical protein
MTSVSRSSSPPERGEEIMTVLRILSSIVAALALVPAMPDQARAGDLPQFQVEPFWPKPLPKNWILGQVAGIAVDKDDRICPVHCVRLSTDGRKTSDRPALAAAAGDAPQ